MGLKVKAVGTGFYGGHLRQPGSIFTLADGEKASAWMEVLSEIQAEQKPRRGRPPASERAVQSSDEQPEVKVEE